MTDLGNQEAQAADRDSESRTALTAHTPGPWRFLGDNLISDTAHISVASVSLWNGAAADLRLIAAAPDMLAALQTILGIYSDDESPNKGMKFSERINLVRAAIAKATVIQDFDRVDGAKLERKTAVGDKP